MENEVHHVFVHEKLSIKTLLKFVQVNCSAMFLTYTNLIQGRSKVDNWGADIHIFVFCTINFF